MRNYTRKWPFSMLLTTSIVTLVGMSWAFMLGVMVGRGYPEDKVREFTEKYLSKPSPVVQEPPQAILRPEELHFHDALRGNALHNGTSPAR